MMLHNELHHHWITNADKNSASRTPTFLNQVLLLMETNIHVKKLNCRSGLKQMFGWE
jgi:hypothetical protein